MATYREDNLLLGNNNIANINDDEKMFVRIETETRQNEVVRYQYDNHLGSAYLELDEVGSIISYEEYHPFGTTSYRAGKNETEVSLKRYKYNGKEWDEETGLYYYGARYYAAWLCRFISVDPLQFEYPELTPFQYASNRPITCIDLDGCEAMRPDEFYSSDCGEANTTMTDYPLLDTTVDAGIWINGADGNAIQYVPGMEYKGDAFIETAVNTLNTLYNESSTAAELIDNLVGSKFTYNIVATDGANVYSPDSPAVIIHDSITNKTTGSHEASGGTIKWNKDGGPSGVPEQQFKNTIYQSIAVKRPEISLIHELAHADDNRQGTLLPKAVLDDNTKTMPMSDWKATNVENSVRAEMNLPLRTHYVISQDGKPVGPKLLNLDFKGNISSVYNNKHFYPKKMIQ
jgi:RHS repeat-associated protein